MEVPTISIDITVGREVVEYTSSILTEKIIKNTEKVTQGLFRTLQAKTKSLNEIPNLCYSKNTMVPSPLLLGHWVFDTTAKAHHHPHSQLQYALPSLRARHHCNKLFFIRI
jgi:hypothetical protein